MLLKLVKSEDRLCRRASHATAPPYEIHDLEKMTKDVTAYNDLTEGGCRKEEEVTRAESKEGGSKR